jgi:hypothetical protein
MIQQKEIIYASLKEIKKYQITSDYLIVTSLKQQQFKYGKRGGKIKSNKVFPDCGVMGGHWFPKIKDFSYNRKVYGKNKFLDNLYTVSCILVTKLNKI